MLENRDRTRYFFILSYSLHLDRSLVLLQYANTEEACQDEYCIPLQMMLMRVGRYGYAGLERGLVYQHISHSWLVTTAGQKIAIVPISIRATRENFCRLEFDANHAS